MCSVSMSRCVLACTGANIGIVLLSQLAGASAFLQHGTHVCPRTIDIAFPDYTDSELVQVSLFTLSFHMLSLHMAW